MRQADVEGLGLAFLHDWAAGDDIKNGKLVQLFPECSLQSNTSTWSQD